MPTSAASPLRPSRKTRALRPSTSNSARGARRAHTRLSFPSRRAPKGSLTLGPRLASTTVKNMTPQSAAAGSSPTGRSNWKSSSAAGPGRGPPSRAELRLASRSASVCAK
eukprot:2978603-Lingulodinium_polyedra.AAC.1